MDPRVFTLVDPWWTRAKAGPCTGRRAEHLRRVPWADMVGAALAIADEAQQGVLARPVELESERWLGGAPGLYGTAIRWCGCLPVFENSIVLLPVLSQDALKPYWNGASYAMYRPGRNG